MVANKTTPRMWLVKASRVLRQKRTHGTLECSLRFPEEMTDSASHHKRSYELLHVWVFSVGGFTYLACEVSEWEPESCGSQTNTFLQCHPVLCRRGQVALGWGIPLLLQGPQCAPQGARFSPLLFWMMHEDTPTGFCSPAPFLGLYWQNS